MNVLSSSMVFLLTVHHWDVTPLLSFVPAYPTILPENRKCLDMRLTAPICKVKLGEVKLSEKVRSSGDDNGPKNSSSPSPKRTYGTTPQERGGHRLRLVFNASLSGTKRKMIQRTDQELHTRICCTSSTYIYHESPNISPTKANNAPRSQICPLRYFG